MTTNLLLLALVGDAFLVGMGLVALAWYASKRAIFKKEADILQDANQKALAIIEEARSKVKTMETKISFDEAGFQTLVKNQQDQIIKAVTDHLQQVTTAVLGNYQETLRKTTEADLSTFKNTTTSLEKAANDEVASFKNILEKETIGAQRDVAQKIQEAYTAAQEEIKKYRQDRLAEVDNHIGDIVFSVSQEVIGKSLTLEDHQDLVISALERAKQEGFFAR